VCVVGRDASLASHYYYLIICKELPRV
jgi:hypothetical protein